MGLAKAGAALEACSASRASRGTGGEMDWGSVKGRASLGTEVTLGVVKEEEGRESKAASLGFSVVGEVGSTAPGR